MARLTRMQKYADRRKEMANENEATQTSSALDTYKNKLDALEANFNDLKKEEAKEEIHIEPIVQEEPQQETQDLTKEYKPKEDNLENDFLSSLDIGDIDKAINDIFNQNIAHLVDDKDLDKEETKEFKPEEVETTKEEIIETPAKEEVKEEVVETPVEEAKEEPIEVKPAPVKEPEVVNIIDENYEDIASKVEEEVKELNGEVEPIKEEEKVLPEVEVKEEPVVVRPAPVKEPEVVNIIDEDYTTIASKLSSIVEELDGKVEPIKEEEKVLPKVEVKVEPEVVEEVKTEEVEEVSLPEDNQEVSVPEEEKSSDYVDEALKEAQEYNKQDGRKTADDVKDMIVDDIRHNKPEEMDAEEFANTVSLEIDKVLNEINNDIPSIDVSDVTIEEVPTLVEEVDKEEVAEKLADTIEHPSLAKAIEKEDVVEIKSMEETLTNDVVDDTIPFMMDDVKENKKQVEYEEIDDEKPNKILNVILIVLIVILLIILGVIVYYLLYAKGVIG